jgi:hypothetical protein
MLLSIQKVDKTFPGNLGNKLLHNFLATDFVTGCGTLISPVVRATGFPFFERDPILQRPFAKIVPSRPIKKMLGI